MTDIPTMKFEVEAYAVLDKEVKDRAGKTGYVYLPREWVGKRVRICLLDECDIK